uniref:Large ribosomal subunit protein eL30 n=1 Tax=Ignisphaera aggregans TaxID=334771 RepID=A0A7C4H5F8_9CREN
MDNVIKFVVRTGKIVIGFRKTLKLIKLGKVRYVVIASNIPEDIRFDIMYYASLSGVNVILFTGTNKELGSVIGKPFAVAVLGIIDTGQVPPEVLNNLSGVGG